jgi:TonB family protein
MKQPAFNKKAAIVTVGAHALLLLLCLLISYSLPAITASSEEMGMEVNLGNSDDGSGDDQPFSTERPAMQPEETHAASRERADHSEDPVAASANDDEDAAPVRTVKADTRRTTQTDQQKPKQADQPKPKLLYPGNTGNGGNAATIDRAGTGEGNGTGPGDKGVPGGTPGAANYTGVPGTGTGGISYSLDNRVIVDYPERDAIFREGGKVVIRVTVNKDGVITNQRIISSSNNELSRIAKQKVEKIRFNRSESAPPEQFGNITFVFKTRAQK